MEHGTSPLSKQPLRLDGLQPDHIKKRLADQRRNSTVSFRAKTNAVTLPPLRVVPRTTVISQEQIRTQIVPEPETNSNPIETHQRFCFSRIVKYILGGLCVCGYLIFPIVSVYTILNME